MSLHYLVKVSCGICGNVSSYQDTSEHGYPLGYNKNSIAPRDCRYCDVRGSLSVLEVSRREFS